MARDDTSSSLFEKLTLIATAAIVDVLDHLPLLHAVAQPPDGVTYARKIDKSEARIKWCQPAAEIERRLREYYWMQYSIMKPKGLLNNDDDATVDSLQKYARKDFFVAMALPNTEFSTKAVTPNLRKVRLGVNTLSKCSLLIFAIAFIYPPSLKLNH